VGGIADQRQPVRDGCRQAEQRQRKCRRCGQQVEFAQCAVPGGGHALRQCRGRQGEELACQRISADHTIEIRRPGSGSHASTLPSVRNHWRANPVMGEPAREVRHDRGLPVRARLGHDARGRPHPRTDAVGADQQACGQLTLAFAFRGEGESGLVGLPDQADEWRPADDRDPGLEHAGRSAARSARSSTIHASARSPKSNAENESVAPASPATRIASIGVTRSPGSRCHAPSAGGSSRSRG